MSPREKHIPDDAQRTSVCLTAAERAAIHWIKEARKNQKDKRTTTNDILVDALWELLKVYGKTKEDMQGMFPQSPLKPRHKVAEMPKKKR